jgi:acyl-coenzyme A synthetase/AMP-(fatty) acid ligase
VTAAVRPAPREYAFATSGHTRKPVVWLRTEEQVRQEVQLLAGILPGAVDRVVNFAPPRHLYGFLFGHRLPQHLGVPVQQAWESPLAPPDLPSRDRTLLVCIPSAWILLRGLHMQLRALPGVVAVHSTGPTTSATAYVADALRGSDFRVHEILGSTETGGLAHRTLGSPQWTLLDDVSLEAEPGPARNQPLRVASGRIARRPDMPRSPAALTLDDVVRPVDERHFELVGRASRLVKVNGRRFQLELVESVLREAFPGQDLVCVPRRDDVRAEHYEVFCTGTAPVYAYLAEALPEVPAPRAVHRVAAIPRSATGKVQLPRLLEAVAGPGHRR